MEKTKRLLVDVVPEIVAYWNEEKNGSLSEVEYHYNEEHNLKCPKCGCEFTRQIHVHMPGHDWCPHCRTGKRVIDIRPDIALYWDEEKNGEAAEHARNYTNKEMYLRCPVCGYRWGRKLKGLKKMKELCPECRAKKRGTPLTELRPDIVKYWADEKNTKPLETIKNECKLSIFLRCPTCGFEFSRTISNIEKPDELCPVCRGKAYVSDEVHHRFFECWDYNRNYPEVPIYCGGKRKFWFTMHGRHLYKTAVGLDVTEKTIDIEAQMFKI